MTVHSEPIPRPAVLCVGLSNLDHIWQVERFPPQGSRTHAGGYRLQGGGPAATAAATVARLGGYSELWAVHGDDPGGTFALDELRAFGVNVDGVRVVAGARSFVSAILVGPDGERWIFPYRGERLLDQADGLPLARLSEFGSLLVDARHPVMADAALRAAEVAGVPSVGDFGDTRHWHLAARVDHLIVSEECAREVYGGDDPEEALATLRQRDDQMVGITLGPEGFLFDDGEQFRHLSALPVEVVDTTGAGDVFHGAYAYALAAGRSVEGSALFASVAAALSCTGVGRSEIPDAARVDHLLEMRTLKEMEDLQWT